MMTAPKPAVTRVCDAVHLTTTTGTGIFNIHRLRRAAELLRRDVGSHTVEVLLHEFPTMDRHNAVKHVLGAQQVISHDLNLDA
jgi:hypothetical protein